MARTTGSPPETTARIIAAAGAVFAERGFRSTTVRQITTRAGVNLAAVNYHFRDKGELYAQVLMEAKRHVTWIVIADMQGSAEEKLRTFITRFVSSLLDPERPAWHGRVLAMEMANPTPALNRVVRETDRAALSRCARTYWRGGRRPRRRGAARFAHAQRHRPVYFPRQRPAHDRAACARTRSPTGPRAKDRRPHRRFFDRGPPRISTACEWEAPRVSHGSRLTSFPVSGKATAVRRTVCATPSLPSSVARRAAMELRNKKGGSAARRS